MKVAIHQNLQMFNHSTNWDKPWIEFCKNNNVDYGIVDCYSTNILEILKDYDCLLWHVNNYSLQDMLFARSILISAKRMGMKVFPDFNTSWHFDDKIAEMYLLQTINAPIPKSWVFYTIKDYKKWLHDECKYPVVAKLRCGSGSGNVKLLKNRIRAVRYANRMFGRGFRTAPSVFYKTKSNIRSARSWKIIIKRFKRIPDFVETVKHARRFPKEREYVYIQEFIPNDGYDLKIVVIGDKLSFIVRNVRKGDFRASGGGSMYYDKALVTADVIKSAFEITDKLGFQCMGYDYLVDNSDRNAKIVEISYGFSSTALLQAQGYWDRNAVWHDEPLNAPEEILKNLLNLEIQRRF
jgi:glutathione synthase/RimK-type ligase-like ATP-grasp enzyme